MADPLEAEVQRLEAEIESLRPTMETASAEFVDAAATALEGFWPEFINRCVESEPEELAQIEEEGKLPALKAEVEEIARDPGSVAQATLVDDAASVWPHLASIDTLVNELGRHSRTWGSSSTTALENRCRVAAAAPAVPLMSAGIEATPVLRSGSELRLKGEFEWSSKMEEVVGRYRELADQLVGICIDLRRARADRDKAEARGRWGQA